MSEALSHGGGRIRSESGRAAARRATDWLAFAAAPTFAIMALLTGFPGSGQADLLCLTTGQASPLGGMAAMYGLMSAFHAPPWLRLVFGRHQAA